MVKSPPFQLRGVWVQFLAGKLRSHMPHGMVKIKEKQEASLASEIFLLTYTTKGRMYQDASCQWPLSHLWKRALLKQKGPGDCNVSSGITACWGASSRLQLRGFYILSSILGGRRGWGRKSPAHQTCRGTRSSEASGPLQFQKSHKAFCYNSGKYQFDPFTWEGGLCGSIQGGQGSWRCSPTAFSGLEAF